MGFFDGDWYVRVIGLKGAGVADVAHRITINSTTKKLSFRPAGAVANQDIDLTSIDETSFPESTTNSYTVKGLRVLDSEAMKIFVGTIKKSTTDIESFVAFNSKIPSGAEGKTWGITKIQSHGSTAVHKDGTNISFDGASLKFTRSDNGTLCNLPVTMDGDKFAGSDATFRAKGQMILPGLLFFGFLGKGNPPGKKKWGPAGDDNTESFVAVKMG